MPAAAQPGPGGWPGPKIVCCPGGVSVRAWARRPGGRRRSREAETQKAPGRPKTNPGPAAPTTGAAAGTSPAAAQWSRLLTQPAQASLAGPRPPFSPRRTTSPRRVGPGRLVSVAFGAGGAQRGLELADAGISLRELHLGSGECDVQPVVVLVLLLVSVLAVGEQPGQLAVVELEEVRAGREAAAEDTGQRRLASSARAASSSCSRLLACSSSPARR